MLQTVYVGRSILYCDVRLILMVDRNCWIPRKAMSKTTASLWKCMSKPMHPMVLGEQMYSVVVCLSLLISVVNCLSII